MAIKPLLICVLLLISTVKPFLFFLPLLVVINTTPPAARDHADVAVNRVVTEVGYLDRAVTNRQAVERVEAGRIRIGFDRGAGDRDAGARQRKMRGGVRDPA